MCLERLARENRLVDAIVRVLIVDDSAYVRKAVRQMLSRSPFVEVVGAARDGAEALEMVEELKPDVVTVDLNMPRVGGLEFIREQMKRRPIPVVVLSSASEAGESVLQALDAGAFDVVQKPTALANEDVFQVAADLIAKVRAAALARARSVSLPAAMPSLLIPKARRADIIVIGVSTGGPQALKQIVPRFPANFPVPIVMVLHMPVGYTELFAQALDKVSALSVAEAREGEPLRPGTALLAPAGYHLTFARRADQQVVTRLSLRPTELVHRPSVDVLFRSAAEVYGDRTVAVVLTGMGSDGTEGASWIKSQGGRVFTEDQETCVVYGMPRSVVEAGLSDGAVPLGRIADTIIEAI
jgi:two-component system chemotaxis response regulator CheB